MAMSHEDAAFVRDLVYQQSAVALDESKQYLLEMRLTPAARDAGLDDIAGLVADARGGSQEANRRIVEALVTHETSFFRDHHPFEALRNDVLPALIEARSRSRILNIWSAACSSGQEAYSIAMTILEHFPRLASWPVRIIGTDISQSIVDHASAGSFRQLEVNRGLPAHLLLKYFDRDGSEWRIKPDVKRLVEFRQLNLLDRWNLLPFPDIVFMRNVLIYFDIETKKKILANVRRLLPRDGALFLGAAETTLNLDDGWRRSVSVKTGFYQVK